MTQTSLFLKYYKQLLLVKTGHHLLEVRLKAKTATITTARAAMAPGRSKSLGIPVTSCSSLLGARACFRSRDRLAGASSSLSWMSTWTSFTNDSGGVGGFARVGLGSKVAEIGGCDGLCTKRSTLSRCPFLAKAIASTRSWSVVMETVSPSLSM